VLKAAQTGEPASDAAGSVGSASGTGVTVAAADEWVEVQRLSVDGAVLDAAELLRTGQRFE
jgi:hypothetical protein